MKRFVFILAALLCFAAAQAQITVNFTADTAGAIAGTAAGTTHYYTSPQVTGTYYYTIELYVTAGGTHATDSTRVNVYGSMDGTNYYLLTDLGTPWLISTAKYRASDPTVATTAYRLSSEGTGAVGWVWHPTTILQYRYIRLKITQYKAASTLTMTRAKLHLFK